MLLLHFCCILIKEEIKFVDFLLRKNHVFGIKKFYENILAIICRLWMYNKERKRKFLSAFWIC